MDVVLYMEGGRQSPVRLVSAGKLGSRGGGGQEDGGLRHGDRLIMTSVQREQPLRLARPAVSI